MAALQAMCVAVAVWRRSPSYPHCDNKSLKSLRPPPHSPLVAARPLSPCMSHPRPPLLPLSDTACGVPSSCPHVMWIAIMQLVVRCARGAFLACAVHPRHGRGCVRAPGLRCATARRAIVETSPSPVLSASVMLLLCESLLPAARGVRLGGGRC
jgi:hypothetical protein